jgi:hypothetical protein
MRFHDRVLSATLERKVVLRSRTLFSVPVRGRIVIRRRANLTSLTDDNDDLLNWVQESKLDVEEHLGRIRARSACNQRGDVMILPELQQPNVLLVHQ